MRIAFAVFGCMLALPGSAFAATFVTAPYEGKTLPAESGPFEWRFVSSHQSSEELGGVAFELNPGHIVERCQGPSAVRLTDVQVGTTYTVTIDDDYSPQWLAEHGLSSTSAQCTGTTPAGRNGQSDSLIIGAPVLPVPETTATSEIQHAPWLQEAVENGARTQGAQAQDEFAARQLEAEFEAQRRAREEQAELAADKQKLPAIAPRACVVPALIDHSLTGAKRLLAIAHCRLGRVIAPKRHGVKLVIARQTPAHGLHLAADASVSVRLAALERK